MSSDAFLVHAPSRENARKELSAALVWAPQQALMALVFQRTGDGDGHPVLVIPGLGTSDTAMSAFRLMLRRAGYDPTGWGLGLNDGYTLEDERKLVELVRQVHAATGKQVSIVGWSLGGAYARAIAQDVPESVRQVITLGTPFKGLEHTTPGLLYEQRTGKSMKDFFPPEVQTRLEVMAEDLPVPYTSIYSREDGIVFPDSCQAELDVAVRCQSIEVGGQHFELPYRLDWLVPQMWPTSP